MNRDEASSDARQAAFSDLQRWLQMRDLVQSLQPDGPPVVRSLPASWTAPGRLGVLAGSFNPLTQAHTELLERAYHGADLDAVAFALSVRTVDKERITGTALEDRLICLDLYCQRQPAHAVVIPNRGLYVDQAAALHAAYPALSDLCFIVGYDKIVQIFDPRYYTDRDADLGRLFDQARLLVAPRAGQGREELDMLLDRPENRRFATGVSWLPLPDAYADLSATQVREEVGLGHAAEAVPAETRAMLAATHAYQPARRLPNGEEVDDYMVRLALLQALAATRAWAEEADLTALLALAWSASRAGQELRAWLNQIPADAARRARDLARFQALAGR